ncbi:MAG: GGDEF domain-containing protein, partial [Solirubrobacteraceae bacterium]
ITEQAARLLDAGGAALVRSAQAGGGAEAIVAQTGIASEPALVAPLIPAGSEWGRLEVHAPGPRAAAGDDGRALLVRLVGLAEQAVVNDLAQRTLVFEATTDGLTGLRNQRSFQRGIRDEVERARRYERPLALVLIDLDSFKQVNDLAGHQTGDRVLTEVARRLLAAVRVEALVARLGGDELAIVLPECDADAACLVAERVREAVGSEPVIDGTRVTVSVGIAELSNVDGEHELIAAADAALYAAKRMGGDTCVRHTPGMSAGGRPPTGARPG